MTRFNHLGRSDPAWSSTLATLEVMDVDANRTLHTRFVDFFVSSCSVPDERDALLELAERLMIELERLQRSLLCICVYDA